MTSKFDAYQSLFQTAWDRCVNGKGASIRLASINDLSTFRTYLSRWKTLKKVEWPDKLVMLNSFRAVLRKDDKGNFLLDFYPFGSETTPHGVVVEETPPTLPISPPGAPTIDGPVRDGHIPQHAIQSIGIDMSQMARRQDWVRILGLRGWRLQDFLTDVDAATIWLLHGPETPEGTRLLERFPQRSEVENG